MVMGRLWAWACRKEEDLPCNPIDDLLTAISTEAKETERYRVYTEDELKTAFAAVANDGYLNGHYG
jgi:hypothetical protein